MRSNVASDVLTNTNSNARPCPFEVTLCQNVFFGLFFLLQVAVCQLNVQLYNYIVMMQVTVWERIGY